MAVTTGHNKFSTSFFIAYLDAYSRLDYFKKFAKLLKFENVLM